MNTDHELPSGVFEGHHHSHEPGHDGHHHFGAEVLPLEKQPLWIMDNIELKSVGIDIGSSGTRLAFSRIKLCRRGLDLSSRYEVISRELLYNSDVRFTPYTSNYELIDEISLKNIIDEEYAASKIEPKDIDTGAIILTGEAIRRKNAEAIGNVLALKGGRFVTVSAGHNQEALLAAHGSGAVELSRMRKRRLLNLDVGGGTAKFALIDDGRVIETCALGVGGRLMVFDEGMRIVRLEPNAKYVADQLGIDWKLEKKVTFEEVEAVSQWMSHAILQVMTGENLPTPVKKLALTPLSQSLTRGIRGVVASGGVGEYVYRNESRYFNDLAKGIGENLNSGIRELGLELVPGSECIRATVVGVSEYTIQVSGNTIYVSDTNLLPFRNLQVLKPNFDWRIGSKIDSHAITQAIRKHYAMFDLTEGEREVALMFHWKGEPAYELLEMFVDGVYQGMKKSIENRISLILVFDQDIARTIGAILKEEKRVQGEVICIDGILLQDFDFIDIGREIGPSGVVPVTVKSLAFENTAKPKIIDPHLP